MHGMQLIYPVYMAQQKFSILDIFLEQYMIKRALSWGLVDLNKGWTFWFTRHATPTSLISIDLSKSTTNFPSGWT